MARTWPTAKQRRTRNHLNDPLARADALAARRVLRDCFRSLRELEAAQGHNEWRLRWVTTITLLRAVGHVLEKVDGRRSASLRTTIKAHWAGLKANRNSNSIFYVFIDKERNLILKEYKFEENLVMPLAEHSVPNAETALFFEGRIVPQSQLVRDAIQWWEILLGGIEADAKRLLPEELKNRKGEGKRPRSLAPLPAADVMLCVIIDAPSQKLIADASRSSGTVELAEGISLTCQGHGPFGDGDTMQVLYRISILKYTRLAFAADVVADWLRRCIKDEIAVVTVGRRQLDLSSEDLKKQIVAKIARRRIENCA